MAKITFIILAHEDADHVADLANLLTEWDCGANAVIHYDANSPVKQFERLKERTAGSPKIHLVKDRVKCGWGDFSLVDAVVRALKLIRRETLDCERVMLISGACLPIRPLAELSQFLDAHPETEFIEARDSSWMVGGLRKERYQYWHLFNHQKHPKLFNWHFKLQQRLLPKRRFPRGLEPRFGSQWWCLTWALCEKILDHIAKHRRVYRFFSTTWIPDEMFFQTMAFRFTHNDNLAGRNLTFFQFNDWGKPVVLSDDHAGMIDTLPYFFARKVSASAKALRAKLIERAKQPAPDKAINIDFSAPYTFPYHAMIAALPKASPLTPSLFQHRTLGPWAHVLEHCPQSFAILYGPPQLTRRGADALRGIKGLTVLGRVLHPSKVDFGPDVTSFHGLHRDDNLIRDFDQPGYFGRILSRVSDMVVVELAPGDTPEGEMALLASRNALVLPILPAQDSDVMRQFYWTLCAAEGAATGGSATPIDTFRAMQAAVDARVPEAVRAQIEAYLDSVGMTAETSASDWQAALTFRHGAVAMPVVENFARIEAALDAVMIEDLTSGMPDDWKSSVSALDALNARWRMLKLNFPVALPAPVLELQTGSLRGIGN